MATGRFVEMCWPNGSFGGPGPNSGSWSIAGTRYDEKLATLLPVGTWLPTAALEEADRKFPLPVSLQPASTFRSIPDLQF